MQGGLPLRHDHAASFLFPLLTTDCACEHGCVSQKFQFATILNAVESRRVDMFPLVGGGIIGSTSWTCVPCCCGLLTA